MRTRLIILLAIAIAAVATFLLLKPGPPRDPTSQVDAKKRIPDKTEPHVAPHGSPAPPSPAPGIPPAPAPSVQTPNPVPPPPSAKRDLENPLAPSSLPSEPGPRSAEEDPVASPEFGKIFLMLRDFRTTFGENPVGTNAEIMKAIMGENGRGARFGPPEGMALNGDGELLDPWGSPYFFHQVSRDVMEIISPGPDKRRGTEDDLISR